MLLLAPDLLQGKTVVHVVDNIATCLAWDRRRSSLDGWTSTLVRACGHVCAALNIDLHTEWRRRRTDRYTVVVDDLSHDRCKEMSREELQAYLVETQDGFPEPLLTWMKAPRTDLNLGINLVRWLINVKKMTLL